MLDKFTVKHFQLIIIFLFISTYCLADSATVNRIIDGDTFEIRSGEKVRLLGINAPEITDIYGKEAKQYLTEIISGKSIELKTDNISNDKDRYNRLLRYAIIEGIDINKKMITDGFAFAYLKYNFAKKEDYRQAQIFAQNNHNGMWGSNRREETIHQKEETTNQQEKIENTVNLTSSKKIFIFILVLFLLIIGLYYYFKK